MAASVEEVSTGEVAELRLIDQESFYPTLEAAGDKLVVVDFYTAWCAMIFCLAGDSVLGQPGGQRCLCRPRAALHQALPLLSRQPFHGRAGAGPAR